MIDHRRTAPATQRNRDPILEVLRRILPPTGLVLEIASGTGEHVAHFAAALPELHWQPSDPDPMARTSIAAWVAGTENVLAPLLLDASAETWPVERADAVICINMVHISPWSCDRGADARSGCDPETRCAALSLWSVSPRGWPHRAEQRDL